MIIITLTNGKINKEEKMNNLIFQFSFISLAYILAIKCFVHYCKKLCYEVEIKTLKFRAEDLQQQNKALQKIIEGER